VIGQHYKYYNTLHQYLSDISPSLINDAKILQQFVTSEHISVQLQLINIQAKIKV